MHGSVVRSPASDSFGAACHPACIVCGMERTDGLNLRFAPDQEGGVRAEFACAPTLQGYPGRLHGGIVATLLDAAMTHCLFARRIRGYTARLHVRFHRPVEVGVLASIHAWLTDVRAPLYLLRSELRQQDALAASAEARFWGES